jgi:ATP-dependent NAD(P)H-hydrate dehydratase
MYSLFYLVIESTFPILTPFKKKGDNGLIGVIGGSLEYSGAPYYSGISSLKSGADVAHIFCHKDAVIPIKSYSPELIVHPGFDQEENSILLQKTIRWLKSMNSLVVGPGLGREESMSKIFDTILNVSKDLGKDELKQEYGT